MPWAAVCVSLCGFWGCKRDQTRAEAPTLPPADPKAVGRMVQGVGAARTSEGQGAAIQHFKAAIKADPKLWEARYDLGVLLANRGELSAAEEQLAEAARLAPNAEDVAVALGEVRRRRGDVGGAIDALQAFVTKHEKAYVARTALVGALREGGQVKEAIEHARKVLVRRAGDPNALSELALSHLDQGEIDTAELLSQEALKAEKKSAVAERTAGLIALRRGDDALAFQHFARASELDPKDTTAQLNIGTVLLQAGVYEKAEEHFRAVLQVEPDDIPARLGLAAALRGQGTRDNQGPLTEAEAILKKVLQQQPQNLAATYNLAVLYADFMQRPKQAVPLYKRFLEDAPQSHPAYAEVDRFLKAQKK